MYRNSLAYFRKHPAKLESAERMNSFWFGAMMGAGLAGILSGMLMHFVATLVTAERDIHGLRDVPVDMGMLLVASLSVLCFSGGLIQITSISHTALVRDLLEEQGAISSARPDTVLLRFGGLAVGGIIGVGAAAYFLFGM
jgi:hypothetical protein